MADVFISYAREDIDFVSRLHGALCERDRETWVDVEGIPPTGEWLEEIKHAIEGAGAFVFVLTPASAASTVCGEELAYAVELNKKLVPILRAELAADSVPQAVARLNWIDGREEDLPFGRLLDTVIEAIDTDLDWVRQHTVLLQKAGAWDRQGREPSLTLRGSELKRFEDWMARAPDMEPKPTGLQSRFVLTSRRAATRRLRVVWSSVAVGVAVASALGVAAVFQSREKARQRQIAEARQLINRAEALRERPPDALGSHYLEKSTVAAARALATFDRLGLASLEADQALRGSMELLPRLVWEQAAPPRSVAAAAFDATGRYLAAVLTGRFVVWDVVERSLVECDWSSGGAGINARAVAVEPSGRHIVVATHDSNSDASVATLYAVAGCAARGRFSLPGWRTAVSIAPEGKAIALLRRGSWQDGLVWNTASREVQPLGVEIWDLDFHPREDRVAVLVRAGRGARLRVLSTSAPTGPALAEWEVREPEHARRLRWSPDGSRLLIGDRSSEIAVYEAGQTSPTGAISGSLDEVVVHPGAAHVARGDGSLVEVRDGAREVARISDRSEVLAFTPPGYGSLATFGSGRVRVWELSGGRARAELFEAAAIEQVAFSADSSRLFVRSGGAVRGWTVPQADAPLEPLAEASGVDAPPAPAGLHAVVEGEPLGSDAQRVVIVEPGSGAETQAFTFERRVLAAAVSPDSRRLAVNLGEITRAGWRSELEIWDMSQPRRLVSVSRPASLDNRLEHLLEFSADGRYLAIASPNGIVLLEPTGLIPAGELIHPRSQGISFRPEGGLAATVGEDGQVRVWELVTMLEIARVEEDLPPAGLALSPNGRWLATASGPRLRLWALGAAELIAQACARVPGNCP